MEVLLESVSHQFPGLRNTNPISPVLGVVLEVLRYDADLFHDLTRSMSLMLNYLAMCFEWVRSPFGLAMELDGSNWPKIQYRLVALELLA